MEVNRRAGGEIALVEAEGWVSSDGLTEAWIRKLGSPGTRANYAKALYRFCLFTGVSPGELIELAREGKRTGEPVAERFIEDVVSEWGRLGFSMWLMRRMGYAVKSFYRSHFYRISSSACRVELPRVKEYRCPTQEEVREFAKGANLRDVALIEFLASAPFREGTVVGLRLRHVRVELLEDPREDGVVHVGVAGGLLKGGGVGRYRGLEQHSFLHGDAAETLRRYLRTRGALEPESPLFAMVRGGPGRITEATVRKIFREASGRSGIRLSCQDMRRFVQTQLEAARVQPNWIRKMMGKTVRGEEAPYSRPKIEQLREAFKSAVPYLTLNPRAGVERIQMLKEQTRQNLEMLYRFGVIEEPAFHHLTERLKAAKTPEEFLEGVSRLGEDRLKMPVGGRPGPGGRPGGEHRVVSGEEEMIALLNEGWNLVRELNSGNRFLMRRG